MSEFNKQKYDNEYAKQNYDRCIFNVPKGKKEEIREFYKKKGYTSLNNYITSLINNDMDVLSLKMHTLSPSEQWLINCYRYADESDKAKLSELAASIDNKLSTEEKGKRFDERKNRIKAETESILKEDFGKSEFTPIINNDWNTNK